MHLLHIDKLYEQEGTASMSNGTSTKSTNLSIETLKTIAGGLVRDFRVVVKEQLRQNVAIDKVKGDSWNHTEKVLDVKAGIATLPDEEKAEAKKHLDTLKADVKTDLDKMIDEVDVALKGSKKP